MITFHALGYWGLFALFPTLALLRILPAHSALHRHLSRAALAALLLIAATVALSY
ncbi:MULTISPECIES: hypothetical protein [unclassified Streptomyces]|uniref:hypothetical protein n=1 Tax=unclassified Streptomyces TaxID=2593676 RepID=UPI0001B56992|nr:hypothetical protein [Streptomyces sp. SPB78]EFL01603.1 predicted protein [Streptomyces sp. SPB78]